MSRFGPDDAEANREQHNYTADIEQVARLVSTTRNPSSVLQRSLQILGEALNARGGAVILCDDVVPRIAGVSWGDYQTQLLELGRELVGGVEADSVPTARQTTLPGTSGDTKSKAVEGVVFAVPIRALNQAVGVMVLFDQSALTREVDLRLSVLYAVGVYLGLHVHQTSLQERLKTVADADDGNRSALSLTYDPDRIIGDSAAIRSVMDQLQQAAQSRSTVLLRGESGTGKELGARALHRLSERREQPFIQLNCAALPESLLESELFGHERGAFTGAVRTRRGRFEMADKGSLFLDEIGDLSLATQVKLLRVLQERTFERVGGSRSIEVDVRIIAATNVDLEEAVRQGKFREDLYYRLHVVPIVLPALRERQEDIPQLVGYFLQRYNAENRKSLKISSAAMDLVVSYDWPGNVRELENCVERMVVMARRDIVAPEDVPVPVNLIRPPMTPNPSFFPPPLASPPSSLPGAVADIERQRLVEALQRSGGVQTRAASILGITPRQLGYRLKKYQIDPKQLL